MDIYGEFDQFGLNLVCNIMFEYLFFLLKYVYDVVLYDVFDDLINYVLYGYL